MTTADSLDGVKLRELGTDDIEAISRVHCAAFPESSWTKLGAKVTQRYYLWQLKGNHPLVSAVGAFVGNECAGFYIGGIFRGSTSGFLKNNRGLLVYSTLTRPWLIFDSVFFERVKTGRRLLKRFTKRKKVKADEPLQPKKSFGILAIAVSPQFQKFGIGKKLLVKAEQTAINFGFEQMHLTVHLANKGAIAFYEKLNWQKSLEGGEWKGLMRKTELSGGQFVEVEETRVIY
jgi:ribosomal protein S18 acetylase RimI-like enzyme